MRVKLEDIMKDIKTDPTCLFCTGTGLYVYYGIVSPCTCTTIELPENVFIQLKA